MGSEMSMADEQKSGQGILHRIGSGIWLSAAVCFMLFFYAPLELLFTNQDEFWFDAYILTPLMAIVFAAVFLMSVLVYVLLDRWGKRPYQIGLMLHFIALIGLYGQGNLLTKGLPGLDGEMIDWSLYTGERIKSLVLWGLTAAVIIIVFRKIRRELFAGIVTGVSICMTLMLCVTLLTLALSNDGFAKKPSMSVTTEKMFEMSRDTNFVILVLDAVDGQVMEEMMEERPEYQDIFTDFTFYNNVVAAYPYTKHSIPYILSGEWFENETEFKEYEVAAYAGSPFLQALEAKGYQMALYEAELLLSDGGMGRFENVLANARGVGDKWAFVRWQLIMTGFKYAPYDLKRFCFVNPNAFNELKVTPAGKTLFTPSNSEFYDGVLHDPMTSAEEKRFKFIHIDGGHVPFRYDEDVNEIQNGTYEDNLRACMTITRAYLDKLKENDVYDNSVIIVMADHGYDWDNIYARQNPILYVKGLNEKHEFQVSDAPVSFTDLQEAYARLLDGVSGDRIFDWNSGDERERRFLFHEFLNEDHMVEYIQTGQAHDEKTMRQTGNVYDR